MRNKVIIPRFVVSALVLLHYTFLSVNAAYCQDARPLFIRHPVILPNPNPAAPLAAILYFKPDRPVQTIVEIDDSINNWSVTYDNSHDPVLGLPVLGMRPGRKHSLLISVVDNNGNKVSYPEVLSYTTPPLPQGRFEFPPLKVVINDREKMEPGVTFLSIRRRPPGRSLFLNDKQRAFTRNWGLILGVDNRGDVIWYYRSEHRISGIERLNNGNILFHLHDFRMVEIDMLGNIIHQWFANKRPQGPVPGGTPLDLATLHHQPHELPSGDFLAFSAYARSIDNYYTSDRNPNAPRKRQMVMGDKAVIFDRSGKIKWEWDSFDSLDPFRIGYDTFEPYWHVRGYPGHIDWTHGNGLSYDKADDSVLLFLRKQDAMIKIDRRSRKIVWILGEHSDWPEALQSKLLKPVGTLRWPYHSHNPRATGKGTVIFFDNALHQARPFHKPGLPPHKTWSRAVEYEVNEQNMSVRQVWASAHQLDDDSCNAWAMGDAHRLPDTDNILVIYAMCVPYIEGLTWDEHDMQKRHVEDLPYGARIVEYTRSDPPEQVFRMEISDPDDLMQWNAYGGFRSADLYGNNSSIKQGKNNNEK